MYQFFMHNCCRRLYLEGGPDSGGAGFRRDPAADGRRSDAVAVRRQDFVAFDPHSPEERESRVMRTYALAKQIFDEGGKARRPAAIRFYLR
jgi:hypothetical protein